MQALPAGSAWESTARGEGISLAFHRCFPLKASQGLVAGDGQAGGLLLPQPCKAPEPGGTPRCSGWAEWVTGPWRQLPRQKAPLWHFKALAFASVRRRINRPGSTAQDF